MLPRFSIAFSLRTSTPCRPSAARRRESTLKIAGNSSGLRPDRERDREQQRFDDRPRQQHVHGEHDSTNTASRWSGRCRSDGPRDRIRSPAAATPADPRSPERRGDPVATTRTRAVPLRTFVPMEHRVGALRERSRRGDGPGTFFGGEPLAGQHRLVDVQVGGVQQEPSAGTSAPADRTTTSPGTIRPPRSGAAPRPERPRSRW